MKTILFIPLFLFSLSSIAKSFTIFVEDEKYSTNNLTIQLNDTVVWRNSHDPNSTAFGTHDLVFDDGSFSLGTPYLGWSVPKLFDDIDEVGEFRYHCSIHSAPGMDINQFENGVIHVLEEIPLTINQGIAGAWYFPDTSGSGFFFDVRPYDKFFFTGWFTWDVEANKQRWYTASGNYDGASVTNIPLMESEGGKFDDSQIVTHAQVGSITFDFNDCNSGIVTYSFDDSGLSNSFPIIRAVPGTKSLCEDILYLEAAK